MSTDPIDIINRPISVVHIASGDLWAGAEVLLYQLAKAQHKNARIQLRIVLLNHGILEKKLIATGIPVTVIDETKTGGLRILARLCSYLTTLSPDIVHTHRHKENILGGLAAAYCSKARSLRTVHGAPESHAAIMQVHKHLLSYADWLVGRLCQDRIVAVSAQLAERLVNQFLENKIRIIENGIDIDELRIAGAEPILLPGPPDAINIALIGRLVPVKRVDIFIHVAQVLKERNNRRYAFYVFGDGPLRTDIATLVDRMNLKGQVFMLGFRNNIAAYLSKMSFLLITSEHEGLPMNLLEALALKIPVISRAVGGIPTVLENGKCGVLVDGEDPRLYADAIEHSLADTARISTSVNNGYLRLTRQYAVDHTASQYFQLYLEMLT